MASKKKGKKANGRNGYQHNGAARELTFGEVKNVQVKEPVSKLNEVKDGVPSNASDLFINYTDKEGKTRLLKLSKKELSVFVHETAKASDRAYQNMTSLDEKIKAIYGGIVSNKTPRNASEDEKEDLKEARASLRKEKKALERKLSIEKDKALSLERATDDYAIVLSELTGAELKEYKKCPRLTNKVTAISDEDRDEILEMFIRRAGHIVESDEVSLKSAKTVSVKKTNVKDVATQEHTFDDRADRQMLKILGASEVASIDENVEKLSGDRLYPDKADPAPVVEGKEAPTPDIKSVDNPYEINDLDSKEAKSYLKVLNGAAVASILQNNGEKTGDAEFPAQAKPTPEVIAEGGQEEAEKLEKIEDEKKKESDSETVSAEEELELPAPEVLIVEAPKAKVAAAKKRKKTSAKKAETNKSEENTALLDMNEEDKENEIALVPGETVVTETVASEAEEKPLESEIETPTVGIPVPEANLEEAIREEKDLEKEKEDSDIEEAEAKAGSDIKSDEKKDSSEKVEQPEKTVIENDSVSGINGGDTTKHGTSKRALGKVITAIILIVLIVLFGLWECKGKKGTAKDVKAATATTAVVAESKEEVKKDAEITPVVAVVPEDAVDEGTKADETFAPAVVAEAKSAEEDKATVAESSDAKVVLSSEKTPEIISSTQKAALAIPEFKVVTPLSAYPVKMTATVEGIPLSVNAYKGYAYVTYPENITDEEVDLFMDHLMAEAPNGIDNIGWTIEGNGVMIIGFPVYNSAKDVVVYGDQILASLDSYILASN